MDKGGGCLPLGLYATVGSLPAEESGPGFHPAKAGQVSPRRDKFPAARPFDYAHGL